MKSSAIVLFLGTLFLTGARAQTVVTLTTSASSIDDDIILDAEGNLYGSNYNGSAIFKRSPTGEESTFTGGLNTPNGLAFAADGNLIAVDNQGNRIYRVFPDGTKEIFIAPIQGPSGILREYDSDTLIVTSYTTDKIWKIAPDSSVTEYLTHPEFNGPVGLCYDDEKNLYVANFNDRKIFKVTPDGEISLFAHPPLGQYIGFIAYANGYLYATAMNAHKIYRIDPDGNYSVWLGSTAGTADGDASSARFNQPNGIRASFTGDTLYVSDFGSKRVRMITDLNGTVATQNAERPDWQVTVAPNPARTHTRIAFVLPRAEQLRLEVIDEQGHPIGLLVPERHYSAGRHEYNWNTEGVAAGIYLLKLRSADGEIWTEKVILVE